MKTFIKIMKFLITGCCGFIGTNLSLHLLKNTEHEIIGIDNLLGNYNVKYKEQNLQELLEFDNFTFHKISILDFVIPKVDKVIHLAAIPGVRRSLKEPIFYLKNNVESFIYLLEQCKEKVIKDIIYASSSSVYGDNKKTPFEESDEINKLRSSYACSKKCMEVYGKYYSDVFNLNVIGLRFFTVYGERGRPDMAPYIFLKNISESKEILQFGNGSTMRDYTYIEDIIQGIVSIINGKGKQGEIYNLGNNKPISLKDFIKIIEKVTNKKSIKVIKEIQQGDVKVTYADLKKSKRDLSYEPKISLEEGLEKTFVWMKKTKRITL